MLISDVYVNENAVTAIRFNEGTKGDPYSPRKPGIAPFAEIYYLNCRVPIYTDCSREQFQQAVDELNKSHLGKIKNGT